MNGVATLLVSKSPPPLHQFLVPQERVPSGCLSRPYELTHAPPAAAALRGRGARPVSSSVPGTEAAAVEGVAQRAREETTRFLLPPSLLARLATAKGRLSEGGDAAAGAAADDGAGGDGGSDDGGDGGARKRRRTEAEQPPPVQCALPRRARCVFKKWFSPQPSPLPPKNAVVLVTQMTACPQPTVPPTRRTRRRCGAPTTRRVTDTFGHRKMAPLPLTSRPVRPGVQPPVPARHVLRNGVAEG